jgi:hypothetical protein
MPVGPTKRWSWDFVHGTLAGGQSFRVLTVVDHGSATVLCWKPVFGCG